MISPLISAAFKNTVLSIRIRTKTLLLMTLVSLPCSQLHLGVGIAINSKIHPLLLSVKIIDEKMLYSCYSPHNNIPVDSSIDQMKNGKAPGLDGLPPEF